MKKDEIKKELLKLKNLYSYLEKSNEEELHEVQSDYCKGMARGCIIAYHTAFETVEKLLNKID